jgi:pyruvate formate lyase activating enzyme
VSPDIPWHVTAFHPDYKMVDPPPTTAQTLIRAAEIGMEAGLNYIYAGNLPGRVGAWEDTRCPKCQTTLVRRYGYTILDNKLSHTGGTCPNCGTRVPGSW